MQEPHVDSFKQSPHFYPGRVAPLVLVVFHATAGPESVQGTSAEGVQRMFADPASRHASAHVTCDQNSTAGSVRAKDTAWGATHANACGFHIEQVGLTTQSAQQWADPISHATMTRAANIAREVCGLAGIRPYRLSVEDVRRILHNPSCGLTGLTDHATVEQAWPSTGHTDPGAHWPWDVMLDLIHGTPPPPRPNVRMNPYPRPDYAGYPIHLGGVGSPVQWVQWALQLDPTGRFDATVEAAVKASQRKWLPGGVADGVVGPVTGALFTRFLH